MKQASVHDFPDIEECKLFEGIRCDECKTCESEIEKWLISKGVRRMTDKRFKFICDDEKCFFKDGNEALYCYEVVDLLNSLYKENEQLKKDNEWLFKCVENQSVLIQELDSAIMAYNMEHKIVIKLTEKDLRTLDKALSYYTHQKVEE